MHSCNFLHHVSFLSGQYSFFEGMDVTLYHDDGRTYRLFFKYIFAAKLNITIQHLVVFFLLRAP